MIAAEIIGDMGTILSIKAMLDAANHAGDVCFLWGGFILLLAYPLYLLFRGLEKAIRENKGRDLFSDFIKAYFMVFGGVFFWFLPELIFFILWFLGLPFATIDQWNNSLRWISFWRLFLVFDLFLYFAHRLGSEHGENRWKKSTFLFWSAIGIGWLIHSWMGILFLSIPFLAAYYAILQDIALVIVPASDPEDKIEKRKRKNAFLSYTWGTQSPMFIADDNPWKKIEPRISGDITWEFSEFPIPFFDKLMGRPGLIWTHSHQVATITGGTQFKRVENPGVCFTGRLERPEQIFDLRTQLRTDLIEVVSKDGVHFWARYFTAFRIDNEDWPRDLYINIMKHNNQLSGARKLTHRAGSFPFSHQRVQATLGTTSTRATEESPLVYWDQWVMNLVEEQTRKIISQKKLDEMWRPSNDHKFANALDEISKTLKADCELPLRASGILLLAARLVNFQFSMPSDDKQSEVDPITKQQIEFWVAEWERQRIEKLAKARVKALSLEQEARVYAESLLLNTVVDSLKKAHELDQSLPRHVIALRFLSAFQNYARAQTVEGDFANEAYKKAMAELRKEFKDWQETFFPKE